MTDLLVPVLLTAVCGFALWKRVNVMDALTEGAAEGLRTLATIAPTLVILMTAVTALRESGCLAALSELLTPLCLALHIPPEVVPLMLIRPISGSAALAVGADLMRTYGVDSSVGRTAAIMLGSSETTFYTLSVYFGAAGIKRTRYALPAALLADAACFLSACLCSRLFFC